MPPASFRLLLLLTPSPPNSFDAGFLSLLIPLAQRRFLQPSPAIACIPSLSPSAATHRLPPFARHLPAPRRLERHAPLLLIQPPLSPTCSCLPFCPREREAHITQLQAEAMGLLQSLSADSSHSACLYTSPGAPHAARQLEETVLHYMYGGMCYDEDYDPGMPWLLRLLISGCLLHTVWAVCCNPHLEEALPPWVPVYFVRAAACLLGLSCQLHLWKAFASRGA